MGRANVDNPAPATITATPTTMRRRAAQLPLPPPLPRLRALRAPREATVALAGFDSTVRVRVRFRVRVRVRVRVMVRGSVRLRDRTVNSISPPTQSLAAAQLHLSPAEPLLLVPSTAAPGRDGRWRLSVLSETEVEMEALPPGYTALRRGRWHRPPLTLLLTLTP